MKKLLCLLAVLLSLAPIVADAQQATIVNAPIYKSANTPLPAQGVFLLDAFGNPASTASGAASSAQLAGSSIDMQGATGVQIQIAGLNADTLAISQGMAVPSGSSTTCSTANYVTATVLKHDLSTAAASALTGSSANGIYSVMVFGGCLKITRTGSADTLTVLLRGTK